MDEKSPEFREKQIRLLKIILEEIGDGDINIGSFWVQLGESIDLPQNEIRNIFPSLIFEGFLRSNSVLNTICVTLRGKKAVERYNQKINIQPYQVFISHIHENEEEAIKFKMFLEGIFQEKVCVFISGDPKSISFTEDWFNSIKNNISNCDLMIILCTPESVKRPWIYFEAGAAEILDKKIGPLCFAGQAAGKLPPPLGNLRCQAIDNIDFNKFYRYIEGLIREIAESIDAQIPKFNVQEIDFFHTSNGE